jgi:pimeloyl-ACP methyl ester carboxylesterase
MATLAPKSILSYLIALGFVVIAPSCLDSAKDGARFHGRSALGSEDDGDQRNDDDGQQGQQDNDCKVVGIERSDYLIDFTSNLPSRSNGGSASLDIHHVKPVFAGETGNQQGHSDCTKAVAVMVHGRTVDIVTVTDLRFEDYSLAESLAKRGIESFGVNLLGWGLSSRFSMNDPCNTTTTDQDKFLKPNPLLINCPPSDPYVFSNIDAQVGQVAAAVDHALAVTESTSVSMFAWSRGAIAVGPYAAGEAKHAKEDPQYSSKVKNIVFLAGSYPFLDSHPPFPIVGFPMFVLDRAGMIDSVWNPMVKCADQQNKDIKDPIWNSMKSRDPLGATWGTSGVIRSPNVTLHGWNQVQASQVTAPTLLLTGLEDTNVSPAREKQLCDDLKSSSKVLIRLACASHYIQWEGPPQRGPHKILQDSTGDWMIGETYLGVSPPIDNGIVNVASNGSIRVEPGCTP